MVRIASIEDINKEKLKDLFRKRGHSILTPSFLRKVKEILEGKHQEMEVHQCSCGELMVLSATYAHMLRKAHKTEAIPCKVCGKRGHQMVDMSIFKRLGEIAHFLDERYVFTTKSAATLKPEDVETLGKMALGLFPTNTHAEMLVGYFDFTEALAEHFPKRTLKHGDVINELFDKAKRKSLGEFDRLYCQVLNWEEFHKAALNIYSKQDILQSLLSGASTGFLEERLEEKKKIDVTAGRVQLELSTYKDAVETKLYLDILANISNIIAGKRISVNPFKTLLFSPSKRGGKARVVRSIADKAEYLEDKIPFSVKPIYNTHLRNAIAHNEYEIRSKEKKVVLTRYSETLTFDEFETIFEGLEDLHTAIHRYFANYYVEILRQQVLNQGIGALVMGYTDYFLEQEKLHPKTPCNAQLNIYQYWDFTLSEMGKRIFPTFKLTVNKRQKEFVVDFGSNGALYDFKKAPELVEWLEQMVLTGRLQVALLTIAPVLPKFAGKAIWRVPVGKIMDVYILDVAEKTIDVSSDLIAEVARFLK